MSVRTGEAGAPCTVSSNVKQCTQPLWKQYGRPCKNKNKNKKIERKLEVPQEPAVLLRAVYPEGIKGRPWERHLFPTLTAVSLDGQEVETAQVSVPDGWTKEMGCGCKMEYYSAPHKKEPF